MSQKRRSSSSPLPAKHSKFNLTPSPLMVAFVHVRNSFTKDKQQPSFKDLKMYVHSLIYAVINREERMSFADKLEEAQNYEAFMNILFDYMCTWLDFSMLERIVEYFPNHLSEARAELVSYKQNFMEVLQLRLKVAEEVLKEAKVTTDMPRAEMNMIVTTNRLDVGAITVEDVYENKKFLSSILKIPYHLLVLFSVLYGSFLLEFWIPKELTPRVVQRVEEVWRELWRRKVEGIEVGDKTFDLLQVVMYSYDQSSWYCYLCMTMCC